MSERPVEIALNIDYNSNYYRSVASGVARYSNAKKWRFYTSRGVPQITVRNLKGWKGAGVIGWLSPELISDLNRRGIPAVNIKADYLNLSVASVLIDNRQAGRMVADYFVEKGIRRFAATSWSIPGAGGRLKVQGYVEALAERGYPVQVLDSGKELRQIGKTLQIKKGETVGFFAVEDFLGRMAIEACENCGLRVPEEVAVIGVDNSPFICEMLTPAMSSVELGAERVGYQAALLLDRLIKGQAVPAEPIMVTPERIVERQSTDILEVRDELVVRALRYIRGNFRRSIFVADVTRALICNRRVLEKRFKREVGRTLHEEIRRARVECACRLLRESDMLIESLAEVCGYGSRERFNVAFRHETGKTPSAYRREYRFTQGECGWRGA